MRYMLMHYTDTYYTKDNPPPAEFNERMGAMLEQMNKAGILLAGEGLQHPDTGTKITLNNGKISESDGPYAEAKEVIGGFVMLDLRSQDEAVEWARRFLECFSDMATNVDVEIRRITEYSDFE